MTDQPRNPHDPAPMPPRQKQIFIVGALVVGALALWASGHQPPPSTTATAALAAPQMEFIKFGNNRADLFGSFMAVVPPGITRAEIEKQSRAQCRRFQFCSTYGFVDADHLPGAFPMTDREVAGQVFGYILNRNTGADEVQFNCPAEPGITTPRPASACPTNE